MRPKSSTVERRLARIAAKSHGVVSRRELLDAGITPEAIKRRVRKGALIRVHRGVYRVGHLAPSIEATYAAAVKACGDRAALAGLAAAHLLGIIRRRPARIEVIAPTHRRVHPIVTRRGRLGAGEVTRWREVPVTSVPRTLVDLAPALPEEALARSCHEAAVRHRTTPAQVERVLASRRNWPGARKLRRVLWGEVPVTLSKLESAFIVLVREARLPLPETNRLADGRRVDCRWADRRLTVELDGYRYHHTRHAWEQDRRREREARARGDEFRRYSYGDVLEEPRAMLAELRALLGGDPLGESEGRRHRGTS